jgi:hypothetical protein
MKRWTNGLPGATMRLGALMALAGLTEIINPQGDLRTLPCHLPHPAPRLSLTPA